MSEREKLLCIMASNIAAGLATDTYRRGAPLDMAAEAVMIADAICDVVVAHKVKE